MLHLTLIALLTEAPNSAKTTDILLALFTFFLVVVGFLQYLLVRSQDRHFENSERAWILAELRGTGNGQIIQSDSQEGGVTTSQTQVSLSLVCRNEGRSPAFIDNVWGQLKIRSAAEDKEHEPPKGTDLRTYGRMEPIGAAKENALLLKLTTPGVGPVGHYSIFILIEYHDIFQIKRQTTLGYVMDVQGHLFREDTFRSRNRNT
jgi:hypothetical protein